MANSEEAKVDRSQPATFCLERGVTGFRDQGDPPLPHADPKACRTAWHSAARAAGGEVKDFTEQKYPQSFHSATIKARSGTHIGLFHAHYRLIAFASDRRSSYTDEFQEPPAWAAALSDDGFAVLSAVQLLSPLADSDTSALSAAEWRQIRYWQPATLGATLFNAWD
ncbi:hypothetical protein [Streptomyces syringium]|uniref:Uncharacterized protein n=1 Tax=Streptomyces syringium TaxID=76729 RepID=A0ABS4YE87_9ACTN|nr:hypothetical protein [Streptomyces syringium]MBP2407044.1 hypothetical protein [Streptomyces syringium]